MFNIFNLLSGLKPTPMNSIGNPPQNPRPQNPQQNPPYNGIPPGMGESAGGNESYPYGQFPTRHTKQGQLQLKEKLNNHMSAEFPAQNLYPNQLTSGFAQGQNYQPQNAYVQQNFDAPQFNSQNYNTQNWQQQPTCAACQMPTTSLGNNVLNGLGNILGGGSGQMPDINALAGMLGGAKGGLDMNQLLPLLNGAGGHKSNNNDLIKNLLPALTNNSNLNFADLFKIINTKKDEGNSTPSSSIFSYKKVK